MQPVVTAGRLFRVGIVAILDNSATLDTLVYGGPLLGTIVRLPGTAAWSAIATSWTTGGSQSKWASLFVALRIDYFSTCRRYCLSVFKRMLCEMSPPYNVGSLPSFISVLFKLDDSDTTLPARLQFSRELNSKGACNGINPPTKTQFLQKLCG